MALKSRKLSYVSWAGLNFAIGYGHEKVLEGYPELQVNTFFNNFVVPIIPGAAMTIRDATFEKEELSRYMPGDPRRKANPFARSKEIYTENICLKGLANFVTSYLPYFAGRIAAKCI